MRVVYLHGFASGPGSTKGRFFRAQLAARGVRVSLPDLTDGDFHGMTMSRALAVVDRQLDRDSPKHSGPTVLMGSSLGGYTATLYASRHPERVARLVLLAPAFGFLRRWTAHLGEAAVAQWRSRGWLEVYHYGEKRHVRLGTAILDDGAAYEEFPEVTVPTLILHGRRDESVDPRHSEGYAASRPHVRLRLLDSDHQLLDRLDELWKETVEFLAPLLG